MTTEGRKFDTGKARYDLIPAGPLDELAKLFGTGAAKYGERNWERGLTFGRVFAAMMRHAASWWAGRRFDLEDGQHHLASVAWCAFALMELERTHPEHDDRPVAVEPSDEYFGGLVDGEGHIGIKTSGFDSRRTPQDVITIGVGMTDRKPIDLLAARFGGRVSYEPRRKPFKPVYRWRLSSKAATAALDALRPHLVVKAPQADIALAFQETMLPPGQRGAGVPTDIKAYRSMLREQMAALNRKGVSAEAVAA